MFMAKSQCSGIKYIHIYIIYDKLLLKSIVPNILYNLKIMGKHRLSDVVIEMQIANPKSLDMRLFIVFNEVKITCTSRHERA